MNELDVGQTPAGETAAEEPAQEEAVAEEGRRSAVEEEKAGSAPANDSAEEVAELIKSGQKNELVWSTPEEDDVWLLCLQWHISATWQKVLWNEAMKQFAANFETLHQIGAWVTVVLCHLAAALCLCDLRVFGKSPEILCLTLKFLRVMLHHS